MTTNRRYAQRGDDETLRRMQERERCPVTLPPAAWGPQQLIRDPPHAAVWVWVQWSDKTAERRRGVVKGYNDRVVHVVVEGEGGGWDIIAWRTAVTIRRA